MPTILGLRTKWLTLLFSEYKTFICWAKLLNFCPNLDLTFLKRKEKNKKKKNIELNTNRWKMRRQKIAAAVNYLLSTQFSPILDKKRRKKKIFILWINSRSRCGPSFTNIAQQMNVLYSAEQKYWPLHSQALLLCHLGQLVAWVGEDLCHLPCRHIFGRFQQYMKRSVLKNTIFLFAKVS